MKPATLDYKAEVLSQIDIQKESGLKPDACKLQKARFACTDLENGDFLSLEV